MRYLIKDCHSNTIQNDIYARKPEAGGGGRGVRGYLFLLSVNKLYSSIRYCFALNFQCLANLALSTGGILAFRPEGGFYATEVVKR